MAKQVWEFRIGKAHHTVAINHHEASGRAALWVDGGVIRSPQIFIDDGDFPFKLKDMPCSVRIRFTGVEYRYLLLVNGMSIDEFKQHQLELRRSGANTQTRQQLQPAEAKLKRARQYMNKVDSVTAYWTEDGPAYQGDAYGTPNSALSQARSRQELSTADTHVSRPWNRFEQETLSDKPYWADGAPLYEDDIKKAEGARTVPKSDNKAKGFFSRLFSS